MNDFEAQCDCELDSPGVLSHLPVEERLTHWKDWALYLKLRIETHYRPELAALKAENARLKCCGNCGNFAAVEYQTCEHPDRDTYDIPAYISAPDPCEMVPSGWTAREDG